MAQSKAKSASHESFPEALRELAGELTVLLRQDLEDARAEMVEKAKAAGMGAGLLSASFLTGLLALFSLTVFAIVALWLVVKLWIAAAIVAAFWIVVTAALALGGKRKFEEAGPPVPERAIAHAKADLQAVREELAEQE